MEKAEIFNFPTVPGSGGRGQSLRGNGRYRTNIVIVVSMVGGAHQKYWGSENKGSKNNSYLGATINHPQTPPENTPNMASAADDSELPSLSLDGP
jgi:hypothetical protein